MSELCFCGKKLHHIGDHKGKKLTEEHKRRISKTMTGKVSGKNNGFYGHHQTPEAKLKIAESSKKRRHTEETKKRISEKLKGRIFTEEWRRKIGESMKGKFLGEKNHMYNRTGSLAPSYGKEPPEHCGYTKFGKRPDLNNQFFRSTWEANFARILNYHNIKWRFEPKRFKFPECTYKPDFYLPEYDIWIEISGHIRDTKKNKLKLFRQYYPDLELIHITGKEWKKYFLPYKEIVPNWEKSY